MIDKPIQCDPLTPAEEERLKVLIEECADLTRAASKALRFGWAPVSVRDGMVFGNRQAVAEQVGNLRAAITIIYDADFIDFWRVVDEAERAKTERLKRYTYHQGTEA